DNMQLMMDELSVAARNLVPLLRGVPDLGPGGERARRMLLAWDGVLDKDSVEAAIYVSWERELRSAVHRTVVPAAARDYVRSVNVKRMIDWLTAPDGRFGDDPLAGRDAVLRDALDTALEGLERRFGSADTTTWRYGGERFKHALIRHPLSPAVNAELRRRLDVGPVPRGGYGGTVHNTGGGDNQTSGASFMIVADTGNWDNSVGLNTPGQAGDPASPHYRDLFDVWARDRYFPVFFSRARIDSVTESVTELEPLGHRESVP
ncbi:MAG: penicillin acylase family protein, partial [Acidobacteria bacterium]|nr:penicillin acylase family protein [Acidobacteriota bacterium]